MAVLREDIVSIGFDIPENPFAGLTSGINSMKEKLGVIDETEAGIKELGREAGVTGGALADMGNEIHAPPADGLTKPLEEIQKESRKTEATFAGMQKTMKDIGSQRLNTGVDKLASSVKKPVTGIKDLARGAKEAAAHTKEVGLPHALNTGIGKAVEGTGKLLVKMKDTAAIRFDKTVSSMKALAGHAQKAANALGSKAWGGVKALGKGAAVGIAAAGTALSVGAVAAFNFGAAYETSLAKVSTIADTTAVSMADLSADVMKLSNATGEDAAGLNEAVYQALSAGADTAGVVGLVNTAVKAAKGGYTDTTTAIDGLTSTLNAYGMETKDAESLANQFLITQNKGKTTFGELASSIGGVAPTANAAGVGVDQLLAGVASLTANGIGTSEAMTGIKAALSNVIKPSSEATKVAKKLGLNFSTAALQSKGLAGFLDDVKTATGGNMDTMAQLFGSVEALNTVLTLTSDQGSQLMLDTLGEMETNTTALDDAYNTMADTAQNSVSKGLNSFKNLGIGLFQANEGPVADLTGLFAGAGQELYDAFAKEGMSGLTTQIGLTLTKVLTTVTGYLPDIIDTGVEVIESLVDGIVENEDQITDSVLNAVLGLGKGIIKVAPKLAGAGIEIVSVLAEGLAEEMPELIPVAVEGITKLGQGLKANAPRILGAAVTIVNTLLTSLTQSAPRLIPAGVEMVGNVLNGLVSNLGPLLTGATSMVFALGEGLINSIPVLIPAAVSLVQNLVQGLVGHVDMVIDGSLSLVTGLLDGLIDNAPAILEGGVQIVTSLVVGLIKGIPKLIAAGPKLVGALIDKIKETDWLQLGIDIVKGVGNGVVNGIKGLFGKNKDSGAEAVKGLAEGMKENTSLAEASAEMASKGITTEIDSTDLYGSGKNIMSGLNDGMLKMQPTLNATASSIGTGISNSLNGSLDIHSPSRVTEETGEYTGLGLVKGIEGTGSKIKNAARTMGDMTTENITPYKSHYSPQTSQSISNSSSSQVNNWNPVFNLTLNGASASDSNERKVKRWVKDSLKEAVEGMGRTNPRLQEV